MKMDHERRPTSEFLEKVVSDHSNDFVSVGELNNAMRERGFGVLMAVAALPACIPTPFPMLIYTKIVALPILVLCFQMIYGKDSPWLPRWIAQKKIARKTLADIASKGAERMRKIEKLLKPRMAFLSTKTGEKIIGIFAFWFAVSIALPLPFTSFLPAMGILLMSLGLLGKDGLIIAAGMAVGSVGLVITWLVLVIGEHVIVKIF